MRIFNFLARNISYTFAISFTTIVLGFSTGLLAMLLSSSFIVYSYEKLLYIVIKIITPGILTAYLGHFIFFGLLTPLGIPAFLSSHRFINKSFKREVEPDDEGIKSLYEAISDLPLQNLVVSLFAIFFIGLFTTAYIFVEYKFRGRFFADEVQIIVRFVVLSILLTMILFGFFSYLIAESLTNNERTYFYNQLLKNEVDFQPRSIISMQVKLSYFIVLMIIGLLSYAALLEKSNFHNFEREIYLVYFLVALVAGYSLMRMTTRSVTKILTDMGRVTREIASGGRAAFQFLSLDRDIVSIEQALMEMAIEMDEHRKNLESKVEQRTNELQSALANLKVRDDQIQKQLDMASVIQRSILPGNIDDWNELKFSVRYIAMEKIGGDFYDVHQLKDDKLGVMIADVSGHGIPAALVTTMAKISFGNAGLKYDSPRRIFQEVNQSILDHVKTQDYMTCFMVAIDDEYNVVYSNASHQKAILLRTDSGEVELLDTNGLFIGAIEDARDSYEERSVKLNYGDRIILYTDGIPEATNEERKEYSNRRLESVVRQNSKMPLEEFCDTIIDDVENHIGNSTVEDDITLLVIELARDEAVSIIRESKKMVNLHKYYESIELLEEALNRFHNNQKILYNLAKNHFRVNNFSKAVEYIERYLDKDKRNKYAFYIAGASCYQMMDYKRAIDFFDNALELDNNFSNVIFAEGMAYKKMGMIDEAKRSFERVVIIDPDNKMALFELNELKAKNK